MSDIHNLLIYRKAISLIRTVYKLINLKNCELSRDYALIDQIKRSCVSVASNISEGYYRSRKQTKNYLQIASGSANETRTLLEVIAKVYGIPTQEIQNEYIILGKQINAFSSRF